MAHVADYRVRIAGDDQGQEDVTIGRWDTLSGANDTKKKLDEAGYDAYIEADLLIFDENMIVNEMMNGGWGDHCFGELFRTIADDAGFNTYDYKKCLFYKGADGAANIPLAWLDNREMPRGEYIWRLLPDGIHHYLANYNNRGALDQAVTNHLRAVSNLRAGWMGGYETRRL